MKILLAHNYYQLGGGEDSVVSNEKKLLEEKGHLVIPYYRYNEEINSYSSIEKFRLLKSTTFSKKSYLEIIDLLKTEKPDVCHVHNFLPLISPAIFKACKYLKIPVVFTLHNYRLICSNGLLYRNGRNCEDCITATTTYGSVLKKCYRNSSIQTYAIARMIEKNKAKNTWTTDVDAYLCLTDFAKQKFLAGGLPEEKLTVKPNFVNSPPASVKSKNTKPYFIYVGRLDRQKGVKLLSEIAPSLSLPIKFIGEGELQTELIGIKNVELLGKLGNKETLEYIKNATALLFPSYYYEGMPMTILEAFAHKTLVIASNIGAMKSIISNQINGLLFTPKNSNDLIDKIQISLKEKELVKTMVAQGFEDHINLYSENSNYNQLISIYSKVIQQNKK